MEQILVTLVLSCLTLLSLIGSTVTVEGVADPNPKRLVMELIHRDSPRSPYYNKSESPAARLERTMKIIRRNMPRTTYEADLYPSRGIFFVNFSIGQPPVSELAVMDIGSNLLWIPCGPCTHCSKNKNNRPTYNYKMSSTYNPLPCNDPHCIYPCTTTGQCSYYIGYVDGSGTSVKLATEQLTFPTIDGGVDVVHDVVFGCAEPGKHVMSDGIFGLDLSAPSLARRFTKFSYCIGNAFDSTYPYNKLRLGSDAPIGGDPIPLQVHDGFYHVELEGGISMAEVSLAIDPNVFKYTGEVNSGVILDSGSTMLWLVKEAYDVVVEEITRLLQDEWWLTPYHRQTELLCYWGRISEELKGFPALILHLGDGAELALEAESLFYQRRSDHFCVALGSSDRYANMRNQTIIGMMAQQGYNVGFDISGKDKQLFLERIDCELLED